LRRQHCDRDGFDIERHPEQAVRQPEMGSGDGYFVDDLDDVVIGRMEGRSPLRPPPRTAS